MIDLFDLLAFPGALKSLLQHYNSKASVLQHSAFLMIQLSHSNMIIGKTIPLPAWIFVSKVISLLLPKSKHLLILWLQSPSAVILEPKKLKSVSVSIVSPLFEMK